MRPRKRFLPRTKSKRMGRSYCSRKTTRKAHVVRTLPSAFILRKGKFVKAERRVAKVRGHEVQQYKPKGSKKWRRVGGKGRKPVLFYD